jgi:hypothetical protein
MKRGSGATVAIKTRRARSVIIRFVLSAFTHTECEIRDLMWRDVFNEMYSLCHQVGGRLAFFLRRVRLISFFSSSDCESVKRVVPGVQRPRLFYSVGVPLLPLKPGCPLATQRAESYNLFAFTRNFTKERCLGGGVILPLARELNLETTQRFNVENKLRDHSKVCKHYFWTIKHWTIFRSSWA